MNHQFELEFLDNPGQWHDKVISVNPYVKIMGKVGWSHKDRSYTAVAQVESCICIVSLKLKEVAA